MYLESTTAHTTQACHHCGEDCPDKQFTWQTQVFCCNGCKMVYQLLSENAMTDYYRYAPNPGISKRNNRQVSYEYLDDDSILSKLHSFRDGGLAKVILHLPQIHCSSCLWLLENLNRLDEGVIHVSVNFTRREANITYDESKTSLRQIAELLDRIGYAPRINYDKLDGNTSTKTVNRSLLYKLGLAGFAFGNIMLLSFPEYLGFDKASYLFHLGYINLLLAIPVLLYSGIDYIKSAIKGLRIGELNIDLPIAIGMITLFSRSVYEIVSQTGEGYLDSFAGFVFFLLIGRWFQSFTYKALDFDRSYKAYFPISATILQAGKWITKPLDKLQPGDIIRVRNQELIPVDGIVKKGKASIDYSFVTGESNLIDKHLDQEVYAGGKQMGSSIELIATKRVDQSYLTQLWNDDAFTKNAKSNTSRLIEQISRYFTAIVLAIAALTLMYWWWYDSSRALFVFTAVLIVACPCALALAIPFTYGNILRILSQKGIYLRNVATIEQIQDVDYIIFDKTGTLTNNQYNDIRYDGKVLSDAMWSFIRSACAHSSHPLSKSLEIYLAEYPLVDVDTYHDYVGSGLTASLGDDSLRLGSSSFIFNSEDQKREKGVFIEVNGEYCGYFSFAPIYRERLDDIMHSLDANYNLGLLSGDADSEQNVIEQLMPNSDVIRFEQTPADKLAAIKSLQNQGHKVMMLGDGLNDAGALRQSDVGLVISDEINNFSPACDGIIASSSFVELDNFMRLIKRAKYIIYGAFGLAFLYNSIGLYFAVSGLLSPVIAAILMPLSSISVIIYGVVASYIVLSRIR